MFATFILHYLESVGVRGDDLRQKAGLEEGWLERLTARRLLMDLPAILAAAIRLTRDEALLLRAGVQFHFCLAGLGGFAALHAPTPRLALDTFGRFARIDSALRVTTLQAAGETSITAEAHSGWPAPVREQMLDGFASCIAAAIRVVCKDRESPRRVLLMRSRPSTARDYARILQCDIQFDAGRTEVVYEDRTLDQASAAHDPLLYEQLRFAANLRADESSDKGPVRQLIEQALRGGATSIDRVAEVLQLSSRTLQRRLQIEGTTFRAVQNEVRVDMARSLLVETELPLPEIARRLQYADDKVLRRAIKRVTGRTPTVIRQAGDKG